MQFQAGDIVRMLNSEEWGYVEKTQRRSSGYTQVRFGISSPQFHGNLLWIHTDQLTPLGCDVDDMVNEASIHLEDVL